jgi:molecular chaperone GrpE (heat shock protein)
MRTTGRTTGASARKDRRSRSPGAGIEVRVLAVLAALRGELRAERQVVREVRDRIDEALTALDAGLERWLGQQEALMRRLEDRGLDAAEQALFDIADRLDATLHDSMLKSLPLPRRRLPWRWGARIRDRLRSVEEGLRLTQVRLEDHLTGLGIQRLPTIGRAFDPATMEAVDRVIRPDLPVGTVIDEVAAGYRRGDRILRPARVVVTSTA